MAMPAAPGAGLGVVEGESMVNLKDFDLSEIRYDTDSMQVVSMSRASKKVELPLTRGPINFSVARIDGKFSNLWGLYVGGKGDAYVYCRDNPQAEKVSLHVSGRQHVSIRSEVAEQAGLKSRFGNIWSEPKFEDEAVPTFSLLFPPWGVGIDAAEIITQFKNDELLIVGHKEKLIVVAFFIVDSGRNMQGLVPHIVLGQLPIQEGKTLHVIAWKEAQGGLMDKIRSIFPQVSQRLGTLRVDDGDLSINVQGYRRQNSAYMVAVPVHYTAHESKTVGGEGLADG